MALTISFSGKRVLVTGGGKGIGRSLIAKLYKDDAVVFTIDRDESLVAKLKEDFPKITAVCVDVADWSETAKVIESFGPLHHLVNNAGIGGFGQSFGDITEEAVDKTFAINYKSIINISQTVTKGMIANNISGTVVNLASLASRFALPTGTVYSSTKAALVMLTKCMAFDLGQKNIRVNCVCPTYVNTDMMRQADDDISGAAIARGVIQRAVEPEEVADLILYLLSSKSAMVTGEQVFIDGGYSLH